MKFRKGRMEVSPDFWERRDDLTHLEKRWGNLAGHARMTNVDPKQGMAPVRRVGCRVRLLQHTPIATSRPLAPK